MATLGAIEYADAGPEVRAVYDDIMTTRKTDWINNFWKALANDPATLKRTWADIKQIMAPGALDPLTKELIYVAVSVTNQCDYCIASHIAGARKKGMTDDMFRELMAVVGMANESNRLVAGYQVDTDEQLFATLDPEMNSIAIIVKHMAGNMRSRWTDFLVTDGEKPDRNRDTEFEAPPQTRAGLVALWEAGWRICLDALDALSDEDLTRTVTIRTEPHSVMQAINRQVGHYAHHVGQIVLLAKHFAGEKWQTLSVPKKKSADFNRRVAAGEASQR